jgi:hypothetical protein
VCIIDNGSGQYQAAAEELRAGSRCGSVCLGHALLLTAGVQGAVLRGQGAQCWQQALLVWVWSVWACCS